MTPNTEQMVKDIKQIAELRGLTHDDVIVEIVSIYAPIYLNQIKRENKK